MGDPGQDGAGPARRPVRRALGAARRLLRLPTQSARSHEQLLDVLDELRSTLAGLEVQSAGVRAQLDQVRSEAEGVHALAATTHAEALAARKLLEGLDPPARPEMVEEVGRRLDDLTTSVRGIVGELRQSLDEQAGRARLLAATTAAVADHVAVGDGWTIEEGPLVSVVVPVRNRHDVLPGALASLRAQTYGCWECLLVDDGSTEPFDDALVEGDARVRVLRTPASGVAAARNAALAEATGELVAFLDSDNEWYPSRLARVVGAMAATPSVGWAVDGQLVDDVGGFPHVRDMRRPLAALDHRNLFDIGSVVVRRRLLDVVGGFIPVFRG